MDWRHVLLGIFGGGGIGSAIGMAAGQWLLQRALVIPHRQDPGGMANGLIQGVAQPVVGTLLGGLAGLQPAAAGSQPASVTVNVHPPAAVPAASAAPVDAGGGGQGESGAAPSDPASMI